MLRYKIRNKEEQDFAYQVLKVLEGPNTCRRCPSENDLKRNNDYDCVMCRAIVNLPQFNRSESNKIRDRLRKEYTGYTSQFGYVRDFNWLATAYNTMDEETKTKLFRCPCSALGSAEATKRAWINIEEILPIDDEGVVRWEI